ncbi:dnaA protein helix-turn-helix [Rhizobium sp. RU20A]|nr:dnaA protein helix-turn-helix [Rhizobium sp. RU20A]
MPTPLSHAPITPLCPHDLPPLARSLVPVSPHRCAVVPEPCACTSLETPTLTAALKRARDARCRMVRSLTVEMLALSADRVRLRRDSACKVRQIAMYVCHVTLRMPMVEVGLGFGRDRTTVSHACNVVEDRRDEPHFDALISAIERVATLVFPIGDEPHA